MPVKAMSEPMSVVTCTALDTMTREYFPGAWVYCLDSTYRPLKRDSVERLGKLYWRAGAELNLLTWRTYHDCDDKAMLAKVLASAMHRKAGTGSGVEGAPVGIMAYRVTGSGWHMINCILTERGIETWEPQHQDWCALSEPERLSCRFVLW
jgi:hypothetical protein